MTSNGIDFAADAQSERATLAPDMGPIARLVREDRALADKITLAEAYLEKLKKERRELLTERFVRTMDELGQPKTELTDGTKVSIVDFIEASIPSDTAIENAEGSERDELIERKLACLAWLEEQGLGGIIKSSVIIDAGKGDNLRKLIINLCKENNLTYTEKRGVHAATLKKSLREMIDKTLVEPPTELFNLHRGRIAKISNPKTSKA